jgi:hypothetical protein
MKNILHRLTVLALVALLFSSCEKTEDLVIDYKHGYYPDQLGHYVIYDVDSIVFDEFADRSDTFRYQKKYVVDTPFVDGMGRDAFRIVRYHRADSTQGWSLSDVWWAVPTNNALEVVEENQRFIKLVFPPKETQKWDGNKYLADSLEGSRWFWIFGDWEYTITALDVPATVNGLTFDSTLTVMHKSDSTHIERVVSEEQYAKGVGMIYKRFSWLEKNEGDITRPWTEPETGFILTMKVNSYGD